MAKKKQFKHRLLILRRIWLRHLYRLLGPLNTGLQPKKNYCIKAGYHESGQIEKFDDRLNTDEWQTSVYASALGKFREMNGQSVIDVGCGSAFKLISQFGNYQTSGIELDETCDWLLKKYPDRTWLTFQQALHTVPGADLVICSDVIEHVEDPDILLNFLQRIKCRLLVISTPERDLIRGENDFGPPENTSHYREWNSREFHEYISKWFIVDKQVITRDKSISQVLFCIPQSLKNQQASGFTSD